MPAISSPSLDSPFSKRTDAIPMLTLIRREIVERSGDHGAISKPSNISPGVLVVFCLLGASLGLLAWWLFIRRSGFIWRSYDWQEYKASVLRRPEERPDDAVTVFSDGTARKGGPNGSSVGARTVVLGELDTTYTKSYVSSEKPWGPRDPPPKRETPPKREKKKGLIGSVWGRVEGSVWGRLRGGEHPENDTVVQREKSLRRDKTLRRSRHRSSRRRHRRRDEAAAPEPSVISEIPAPPLTDITRSSEASAPPPRRPARVSTRAGKAAVTREPSYAVGDDRGGARYHRHRRTESAATEESSSSSSDDTSSSESDSDDSSDDDSIDQSQLGMAKGNKVYHHPLNQEQVFWGNARPVERNGGGAGGTYGGGAPAIMGPRGRGYRAGSVGSLSSDGSVRSSNAGR